MSSVDTRHLNRDSMFLLAELRLAGDETAHRIKVRNLSPGGMMAEGDITPQRGTRIAVNLRNIGWVEGSVAWVQDKRFGIALAEEIDPKLARAPVGQMAEGELHAPRFTRPSSLLPPDHVEPKTLRKI